MDWLFFLCRIVGFLSGRETNFRLAYEVARMCVPKLDSLVARRLESELERHQRTDVRTRAKSEGFCAYLLVPFPNFYYFFPHPAPSGILTPRSGSHFYKTHILPTKPNTIQQRFGETDWKRQLTRKFFSPLESCSRAEREFLQQNSESSVGRKRILHTLNYSHQNHHLTTSFHWAQS